MRTAPITPSTVMSTLTRRTCTGRSLRFATDQAKPSSPTCASISRAPMPTDPGANGASLIGAPSSSTDTVRGTSRITSLSWLVDPVAPSVRARTDAVRSTDVGTDRGAADPAMTGVDPQVCASARRELVVVRHRVQFLVGPARHRHVEIGELVDAQHHDVVAIEEAQRADARPVAVRLRVDVGGAP